MANWHQNHKPLEKKKPRGAMQVLWKRRALCEGVCRRGLTWKMQVQCVVSYTQEPNFRGASSSKVSGVGPEDLGKRRPVPQEVKEARSLAMGATRMSPGIKAEDPCERTRASPSIHTRVPPASSPGRQSDVSLSRRDVWRPREDHRRPSGAEKCSTTNTVL
jgi:hypothetical protein